MKRYGPLIAVPGAVAIGDPGRYHLRLTPDAVILRDGAEGGGRLAGRRDDLVQLDAPEEADDDRRGPQRHAHEHPSSSGTSMGRGDRPRRCQPTAPGAGLSSTRRRSARAPA